MLNINQKVKPVPELKIGCNKKQKQFDFSYKFKSLKDWFIGIIIRW